MAWNAGTYIFNLNLTQSEVYAKGLFTAIRYMELVTKDNPYSSNILELQGTNFTVVDMQQCAEKKRIELRVWHKPDGQYFCGRCIGYHSLEPLNKFIEHVLRHKWSILNIVRTGFTNATAEGLNRKINVLKSMAYGYKSVQYFILKILQRCGILGDLYTNFTRRNLLILPT